MKKVSALLTALVLLFTFAPNAGAAIEEGVARIILEDAEVEEGREFTLTVRGEASMSLFAFEISFDRDLLTYVKGSFKDAADMGLEVDQKNASKGIITFKREEISPAVYDDAVIATLVFKATRDLPGDDEITTSITLAAVMQDLGDGLIEQLLYDENGGLLNGIFTDATVTILKKTNDITPADDTDENPKEEEKPVKEQEETKPQKDEAPKETEKPAALSDKSIILYIGKTEAKVFGETRNNDVAPIIVNSRTMLPARFVAEALGAEVGWNDKVKTVSVKKGDLEIKIMIGATFAEINGKQMLLDSPAFIENSRTYTPIRFISEALNAQVDWDGAAQKVTITPKD